MGGIDWEFGNDMYMLPYLKQTINKNLLQNKLIKKSEWGIKKGKVMRLKT